MKKHLKIFTFLIFILLLVIFLLPSCVLASSIFKTIDVDDLDLSSIDKSRINSLRDKLENLSKSLPNSSETENEDTNSIDINSVLAFYEELSDVISNEDIANFINDNKEILSDAGISKKILSTSSSLLKNFDTDTVIDIARNDLDMNKIIESSGSSSSSLSLLKSTIKNTDTSTKIKIIFKLLFSNGYFKLIFAFSIVIAIYSVIITSFIFKKAKKPNFATFIPIYRDIIHLKICNFSPWLLLLILVPFIGWLALMAIAVVRKV